MLAWTKIVEQKECQKCKDGVMERTWDFNWKCAKCGYFEIDDDKPPLKPAYDRRASWAERKNKLDEWKEAMNRWRKRRGR